VCISLNSSLSEKYIGHIVDKIRTHISCSVTFFHENLVVYEVMWNNVASSVIRRMRIAHWIPKATDTHTHTHTHTLIICKTYRFSTVTVVTPTHAMYVIGTLPVFLCYICMITNMARYGCIRRRYSALRTGSVCCGKCEPSNCFVSNT